MVTKTKKIKKKVAKSAAKRGAKSTAGAVNKRPVKKVTGKSTGKRAGKFPARTKLKMSAKQTASSKLKMSAKQAARSKLKVSTKPVVRSKQKVFAKPIADILQETRSELRPIQEMVKRTVVRSAVARPKPRVNVRRPQSTIANAEARRALRMPQFTYMKPPGVEHAYEVGNTVEVFCDHEKNNDRIRGWVKGIVVQVDNKLVAVQFRSNVYLTDGWMVPDHILWYPVTSDQIRTETTAKKSGKKNIPEY